MSKVVVTESYLEDIADSIRAKTGGSATYMPGQMAAAIESIPTGGITPTGTVNIAQNGTHDVTQYASANVNVQPNLQSKTATENGTVTPDQGYDGLSSVVVNVSGGGGNAIDIKLGEAAPIMSVLSNSKIGPMVSYSSDYIVPISNNAPVTLNLSQPFEIGCRFKVESMPGNSGRNVWGSRNSYYHCPTVCIFNNKIGYYISTNGSSWAYSGVNITPSGYSFPTNTWISARIQWDGHDMTITVNDGSNTYTATVEGVTPYYNSNYTFEFGGQNKSDYSIASSTAYIDFNNTYMKQNGVVVWGNAS